jgi:hypothetical protein
MSALQHVTAAVAELAATPAMQATLERIGYRAVKEGLQRALDDERPSSPWVERLMPVIRPLMTGALKAAGERAAPYALGALAASAIIGGVIGYAVRQR